MAAAVAADAVVVEVIVVVGVIVVVVVAVVVVVVVVAVLVVVKVVGVVIIVVETEVVVVVVVVVVFVDRCLLLLGFEFVVVFAVLGATAFAAFFSLDFVLFDALDGTFLCHRGHPRLGECDCKWVRASSAGRIQHSCAVLLASTLNRSSLRSRS